MVKKLTVHELRKTLVRVGQDTRRERPTTNDEVGENGKEQQYADKNGTSHSV